MAKESRENVWMQCTSCNDLNYRTEIKVAGGVQKIELKKFCPRERAHKLHKVKAQVSCQGRIADSPGDCQLSTPVAQLAEQPSPKRQVQGSIPCWRVVGEGSAYGVRD